MTDTLLGSPGPPPVPAASASLARTATAPRTHQTIAPVGTTSDQLVEVGHPGGIRRRHRFVVPTAIQHLYGPLLLVGLWAALSYGGIVSQRTFPEPGSVVSALYGLARNANPHVGSLTEHLWASGQRVLKGLTVGIVGGVSLALLGGLTRRGENVVDSIMQIFKAIPNFALLPFLIMWMGIGEQPKVALIGLGTGMAIYMNTYGAIRNVDNDLVEAASTFGVGRAGLVRHVILPGSVPGFLVGLRLALASAWLSLIFAETINAQRGVGYLMSYAQGNSKSELMVAVLVIYAVIGLISYSFVRFLERTWLAWRRGYVAR